MIVYAVHRKPSELIELLKTIIGTSLRGYVVVPGFQHFGNPKIKHFSEWKQGCGGKLGNSAFSSSFDGQALNHSFFDF